MEEVRRRNINRRSHHLTNLEPVSSMPKPKPLYVADYRPSRVRQSVSSLSYHQILGINYEPPILGSETGFRSSPKMEGGKEGQSRPTDVPTTSMTQRTASDSRGRYWVAGMFFTRNERVWNVVKLSGRVLSSTLGLIILLALFTLVGAVLFVALEAPNETVVRNRMTEERKIMLQRMWNITVSSKDITMEDFIEYGGKILKNYTDEVISASQAGITAETESPESPKKWNFWGAVFYCLTVYTTIGYGHIAPVTDYGRIATMLYATIGIPLCLVVLVRVGKIFTRILKLAASLVRRTFRRMKICCRRKLEKKFYRPDNVSDGRKESVPPLVLQPDLAELIGLYEQQDSSFDVPIVVALLLVIIYMLLGAALYRFWETWDYTEAVYFIFISISTIGFGDVLPAHPKFFLLVSVYIFVGLSLVSMVVNVLMDHMAEKLDIAQEKLKSLALKDISSARQQDDTDGISDSIKEVSKEDPPKPSTKDKVRDVLERAFPKNQGQPERVDKIDLSCLTSCTKNE